MEIIIAMLLAMNVSVLGGMLRTVYGMRQELSDGHGRHDEQIRDLHGRVIRLERLWE